ncbi:MAG: hypothetical protein Tsb008_22490 [Rhodothalassiaceae bacterium]
MHAKDVSVVFRGLDHSDAVETLVREEIAKLGRKFDRLIGGTVAIEAPHRHQRQGQGYNIHIRLVVPNLPDIVVSREPGDNRTHDDVYKAVRDAFEAASRQLRERADRLHGRVKTHGGEDIAAGSITV